MWKRTKKNIPHNNEKDKETKKAELAEAINQIKNKQQIDNVKIAHSPSSRGRKVRARTSKSNHAKRVQKYWKSRRKRKETHTNRETCNKRTKQHNDGRKGTKSNGTIQFEWRRTNKLTITLRQ